MMQVLFLDEDNNPARADISPPLDFDEHEDLFVELGNQVMATRPVCVMGFVLDDKSLVLIGATETEGQLNWPMLGFTITHPTDATRIRFINLDTKTMQFLFLDDDRKPYKADIPADIAFDSDEIEIVRFTAILAMVHEVAPLGFIFDDESTILIGAIRQTGADLAEQDFGDSPRPDADAKLFTWPDIKLSVGDHGQPTRLISLE